VSIEFMYSVLGMGWGMGNTHGRNASGGDPQPRLLVKKSLFFRSNRDKTKKISLLQGAVKTPSLVFQKARKST